MGKCQTEACQGSSGGRGGGGADHVASTSWPCSAHHKCKEKGVLINLHPMPNINSDTFILTWGTTKRAPA